MEKWKKIAVSLNDSLRTAIEIVDKGGMQIALVVDAGNKLLGTITDGDVRRALLRGVTLEDGVDKVMHSNPITLPAGSNDEEALELMQSKKLHHIILVKENNIIHDIQTIDDYIQKKEYPNRVILMAGGMGTRLLPLTEDTPKPLIKVGTQPILETVIRNFKEQGFRNITISVNYKSEMIKQFCGNGSKFGVNIDYIDENKRMGTAGALSLLEKTPINPFFVMNSDLLTKVNFKSLLDFHHSSNALATMAVREYNFTVPYGVTVIDGDKLVDIVEKPKQNYFINAGIYVLDPSVIKQIPKDEFFNMPDLFNILLKAEKKVSVFPIREYWMDIGHMPELEKANFEYNTVFNEPES